MKPPGALTPDVAYRKYHTTHVPAVRARIVRYVRTVAACVRFDERGDEQADGAEADGEADQQDVSPHEVIRPDAAEEEDEAAIGSDAKMSRKT